MTRKTKELYVTSFRRLHELAPNFQPSGVMADYEDRFTVALKEVYGQNIHVEDCWFHFSQAVVRKAKKIGLSGAFRDDEHAHKCIRCLTCLPLLPADDISNAVTDLDLVNDIFTTFHFDYAHMSIIKTNIKPTMRLCTAVYMYSLTVWTCFSGLYFCISCYELCSGKLWLFK